MARQWIVLFDTLGLDTLVPWDDIKQDAMLTVLAGKKPKSTKALVDIMILRARANMQRWPEVWAYDTSEDYNQEIMSQAWKDNPQALADLVREKGTCLFRQERPKEIIV